MTGNLKERKEVAKTKKILKLWNPKYKFWPFICEIFNVETVLWSSWWCCGMWPLRADKIKKSQEVRSELKGREQPDRAGQRERRLVCV
jgi:hypothetical protein